MLIRIDQVLGEPLLEPVFRNYETARRNLLPLIDQLLFAPLETVGASDRFEQFKQYIETANAFMRTLKDNYERLGRASENALNICISRALMFDVVLAKRQGGHKAILMPLHPLHLWKFVRLIEIYMGGSEGLTVSDRDAIISEAASDRHFLSALDVNETLADGQSITLPFAGSIGTLPCYENTTNHYTGSDGLASVFYTLDRYIAFYPLFARPLRVTIVDVPNLAELLAETVKFLSKYPPSRPTNIELRLYFTRESAARSYLASLADGENERLYQEFIATGRLSLQIKSDPISTEDMLVEHQHRPAHVMAMFDQSELEVRVFQRQQVFSDSPFCITHEYQYDHVLDEFRVHPVNDAQIFANYTDLVNRLRRNLSTHSMGVVTKTQKFRQQLDRVLQESQAQWLLLADRILPIESRLNSPRIFAKHDGRREILVLASTSEHFAYELTRMLAKYNLRPDQKQLEGLLLDFSHMIGDGLLSFIQSKDGKFMDTKSLGLNGLLTAARDYRQRYADSLIVAIDNQDARRWLRVSDAHQRADLVGIRSDEQGKFIVEAIEVKAREEVNDIFIQKKGLVQGKAVEQVLSIKEALEQAFSGEREALAPPRRETLRDLFYTECQSRRYVNKFRAVWADRLKTLFSEGTPIQFNALIYQIDLRHDQSGEPEIRRADMGDGQIAEIVFTALGEKQVQRLLAGVTLDNRPDLPTSTPEPDDPPPTTPNPVERVLHDSSELKLIHQMPLESEPEAHPMPKAANDVDATWLQNIRDTFKRHARFYNIEITQFGEAVVGFSVIRFPFRLASGTRKERLDRSLEDIGREMAISNLIVQTIPNSQFLALDVPHPNRQVPLFYSQGSDALTPIKSIEELPVSVGISPDGKVRVIDLKRFVHMLVGGTTGAGKTVFLYSVISSLLWTHPGAEDLELILCSSKLEDFSFFRGLPHLYGRDIITEAEDAIAIIGDISRNELDRRGSVLSERRMRSTEDYNRSVDPSQRLHPIVVIVDEFADLSDQVSRDRAARAALYDNIRRIAQIGRSRSVHLVLCTQRPTADLFPSNIKTLMNVRVAFRMNSQTDSRTILDEGGAERLLGKGDMLFKSEEGIERLQGFFVNVSDITGVD